MSSGIIPFRRVEPGMIGPERGVVSSLRKPRRVEADDSRPGASPGRKLLVVEDDRTVQGLFRDTFQPMGVEVVIAGTGEEALLILQRESLPVMFLDLKLPGMSGVALCRRIRKDYPFACIHAMTGYASLFEFADCREAGFDDYFTKPFRVGVIIEAVRDAFEKIDRWEKLRTTWIV